MDTLMIEEFLKLKESGSYLKASEELGITQSTLTRHIQALEKEVGKSLIDRNSHNFAITDAGKAFYIYALTMIEAQKNLVNDLNNASHRSINQLSIGMIYGSELYGIENIFKMFHNQSPDISFNISNNQGSRLVHELLHNNLDLIFIWDHDGSLQGQRSINFLEDYYVLHIPKGHHLYGKPGIHLSELQGEKVYIRCPRYSRTLMYIHQECINHGFDLDLNPKPGYWMSASEDVLYLSLSKQNDRIRHINDFTIAEIYPPLTQTMVIRYKANGMSESTMKFVNFINNLNLENNFH